MLIYYLTFFLKVFNNSVCCYVINLPLQLTLANSCWLQGSCWHLAEDEK